MVYVAAGRMNKQIRIERPVADDSLDGAGSGTWALVEDGVWAEIQDMLPSRAENLADGINMAARPARVRIRIRTDVTPAMRFIYGDRIMQIVAGPAEIENGARLEFVVENYSPAGNPA